MIKKLIVCAFFALAITMPAKAMDEYTQKNLLRATFSLPGPGWIAGFFFGWYKAGEMAYTYEYIQAVRNGTAKPAGDETSRGLKYLILKGLATAPEGIAFYGVGRTLQILPFDQIDPYSVWTAYGRSGGLIDLSVIGAKAAFGAMGAYALDVGLPGLGGDQFYTLPLEHAFLWMAAGGGGWNLVSGTASQCFQRTRPFQSYYTLYRWWSSRAVAKPLK